MSQLYWGLLCDVPKSCKLHRLSKFHSLTNKHRYPQAMIHDVPPLATLLESLPVVKICDLDSPSHAFIWRPRNIVMPWNRTAGHWKIWNLLLATMLGTDVFSIAARFKKLKEILESSKKPVGFHLFYIKDPLLNVWFWQKVPPRRRFFCSRDLFLVMAESRDFGTRIFLFSGATKNAGSKL